MSSFFIQCKVVVGFITLIPDDKYELLQADSIKSNSLPKKMNTKIKMNERKSKRKGR